MGEGERGIGSSGEARRVMVEPQEAWERSRRAARGRGVVPWP
jgi:hypothetical protein